MVASTWQIQVLLFGTFWNFVSKYFQPMVGWIHGCETRRFEGMTVTPVLTNELESITKILPVPRRALPGWGRGCSAGHEDHSSYVTVSWTSVNLVARSYPSLCNPMDWSMPGFPVHYQLLEFTQTHVHRVGDAIQPSHPLSSPFPPFFNPSQHQGLFQWVNSSHEVAKVLEFQLQHQSFQWTPRTDLL